MTTDTQSQPPKPVKRIKQYKLRTYLSDDAGHYLDLMAEKRGISRTAFIEMLLRDQARREGIVK